MYKQIIIVRKDLDMSPGKMSAQVSHASMAFISKFIKDNCDTDGHIDAYFDFGNWMKRYNGIFTKVVLKAKNRNQLLKAIAIAEELGLKENEDFFLIKDNCLTELTPEEVDENGVGRTLTCIGFKPLDSEIADKIGRKYQLFI